MKTLTTRLLLAVLISLSALNTFSQGQKHDLPKQSLCLIENFQPVPPSVPDGTKSILSEDFSAGCPPPGWIIVGDGQTNWQSSLTDNAGGAPPEGMFAYYPQFDGNSKLVSPQINTTGISALVFEFKQMVNDYSGGYTLLVETTSDGVVWNEAWSVDVTGDIEAETVSMFIDNDDVGSGNFQISFTYNGNSNNVNYWYIDDAILIEGLGLDVGIIALNAPSLALPGYIDVETTVKNYGTQTVDFDIKIDLYKSSILIVSYLYGVSDLAPTEEKEIFMSFPMDVGSWEIFVTSMLEGDENPDNNSMGQQIQIIENIVAKKPCFEEFTSSTCIPCAGANPIIDQVLISNPGEYSLIKYQMNWPGAGDPYYTEQGGVRRDYYNVSAIPDLYCNSDQISPASSLNQTIFDIYADQVTGLDIEVDATIVDESVITVNATINSYAVYDAGLVARIVVVEKTTYANASTNSEEEFHNVMMAMLPDASGTALEAFTPGIQVDLSGSIDMTTTFMEQPNDLAVIVFVQDDADESIVQSEMVDVTGTFVTYSVTFNVEDSDGNPVDGALINFDINGPMDTGANGQAIFQEVFPGMYDYEVSKSGLLANSGTVEVIGENVIVDVVLQIPDYYFYEDFGNGLPNDWTIYSSSGNSSNLYWYDGFVVFWMQNANDLVIQLMSPEINLTQAGSLFFTVFDPYMSPGILVGTVSDPSDPDSFDEIASFELTSALQEYEVILEGLPITDSYLAFKYNGPAAGYFYFDDVKISTSSTALSAPQNLTATVDDNDVLLDWDAPGLKNLLGYNVFRDDEAIGYTVETEYTDLDLENGLYGYYVTAVYDEGESGPSNTAIANVGNIVVYCGSEGGGGQYFSHITFGDIDNSSGFDGYGDYTDLSTDIERDETYTLSVTIASPSTGDDIGVWIDFDHDGVFDDEENLICEMDNNQGVFNWEISVPGDATLGETRMRLKDKYWEMGCDPCGYTTWGETEDYSVNIVDYTGIEKVGPRQIQIFPNPASDVVNIKSGMILKVLRVYNYSGQIIIDGQLSGKEHQVNTSQLDAGIYLFKVETEESSISERVIIGR